LGKRTKEKGEQEKESYEDMATSKYFMGPVFVWPESLIPVTPKQSYWPLSASLSFLEVKSRDKASPSNIITFINKMASIPNKKVPFITQSFSFDDLALRVGAPFISALRATV